MNASLVTAGAVFNCILSLVPCGVINIKHFYINYLVVLRCSEGTVDLCPGV
jgi:hypothetical protein